MAVSGGKKSLRLWKRVRKLHLSATQIIPLVFAGIILLGTALLALPIASRSGNSCGIFSALFTATSATCVTGLMLFDTFTQWSGFGQTVILLLIEVGGLGFMSIASLVIFMLRRKVGLKQRMVMAQAMSLNDMQGVVRLQKIMLFGSLGVQLTGALILLLRFWPVYGFRQSLVWGIFHSVSAFCNAGFDIFGKIAPGQSVIPFNNDPIVLITLMLLITTGGLGFFVWEELARVRKFKKFSVYTKLVLIATAAIIEAATVNNVFFIFLLIVLLVFMIFYKSVDGALNYIANGEAQAFGSFFYLLCKVYSYAAYYVYGQPRTAVHHSVALEELCETAFEKVVNLGICTVLVQEGCKARQETVGQGLTVYTFQNVGNGKVVLCEEFLTKGCRKLFLYAVAHKLTAKVGSTSFVAQDVAERGGVLGYLLAVEEAGI